MPLIDKIRDLCTRDGLSITKLEVALGYGNGSITKSSSHTLRSDRIQKIAEYFDVTPTYLLTSEMKYCVCPVCAVAYDPLLATDLEQHERLHRNYLRLREKIGYLLNPSQAATKRSVAKSYLEDPNLPNDGKLFHYETLVQCDFAEHAYFNDFIIDVSYADFIREEIKSKKYFELLNSSVIKNISSKYNVDPDEEDTPLIELFQTDKTFMQNITDLWDLPQQLRFDVYKAIRHAKRDYADKEYYTNPYANIANTCYDYDATSEKCQNCEKGIKHDN